MPAVLRSTDVVYCCEDGFGLPQHSGRLLVEALASGAICLVSKEVASGYLARMVDELFSQLIIVADPRNVSEVEASIVKACAALGARRANGAIAREAFGLDGVIGRYEELLSGL